MPVNDSTLLKYTGSYREVSKNIAASEPFKELGKEGYLEQIQLDENRTPYFTSKSTVNILKKRLKEITGLSSFQFTQGDFMGTGILKSAIVSQDSYMTKIEGASSRNEDTDSIFGAINLSYIDDTVSDDYPTGRLCGVAITCLRDDTNTKIKTTDRPFHFAISIIKDVNQPLDNRTLTVWTNPQLLSDGSNQAAIDKGEATHSQTLNTEIATELNSAFLKNMFEKIYPNGQFSYSNFMAVKERIITDKNIDNRDIKKPQVEALLAMGEKLQANVALNVFITKMKVDIEGNCDFFEESQYKKNILDISRNLTDAIKSLDDSDNKSKLLLTIELHQAAIQHELNYETLYARSAPEDQQKETLLAATAYRDLISQAEANSPKDLQYMKNVIEGKYPPKELSPSVREPSVPEFNSSPNNLLEPNRHSNINTTPLQRFGTTLGFGLLCLATVIAASVLIATGVGAILGVPLLFVAGGALAAGLASVANIYRIEKKYKRDYQQTDSSSERAQEETSITNDSTSLITRMMKAVGLGMDKVAPEITSKPVAEYVAEAGTETIDPPAAGRTP